MFGWEFPPYSSGGLGTACQGLTKGLNNNNVSVTFVLPSAPEHTSEHLRIISAMGLSNIQIKHIDSIIRPYIGPREYTSVWTRRKQKSSTGRAIYGENLIEEVHRFAEKAKEIALFEDFDVIHCHDWMTFLAGVYAKQVSNKKLIVHVHATEFDRTGGNSVNQHVYDIEKYGMEQADLVIAVSNYTKSKIVNHYGIDPKKVQVVHNAVEFRESYEHTNFKINQDDKIVLFLGRLTLQKGPDYFIKAAKKVLEKKDNVKFIIVGSGDMEYQMIELAAELGIADKVLFAGFLSGADVDKAYKYADLYVMPSVSEPFGITPLEAMRNGTPVLISKQSGVSEVIKHCLKVDFWDIDQMANKILAVLKYEPLHHELMHQGGLEVRKFSWNEPAKQCIEIYNQILQ